MGLSRKPSHIRWPTCPGTKPACTSAPASQALAPGRSIERQGATLLLALVRLPLLFFFFFFIYLLILNK
jgi:hypothetical protein